MINILFEGMTENRGGKEAYIMNMFRAFDKTRYAFSFIACDKVIAYEEEIFAAGARILWVPPRCDGLLAYRKALHQLFKKNHFDVLWANKTSLSSCEILEIAKKHGVPVRIVHSHCSSNMGGKLTWILHQINKRLVGNWANVRFACSDTAAAYFFGRKSVQLMKNGIDVDRFRFQPEVRYRIRVQLGLDDCLVIGHVGRFGVEKNHQKLISIFHELKKQRQDVRLLLCGDGEKRADIETQVRELDLQDSVMFLGVIDNVHEILQAMDLLVMPSLFEGLPFTLLEAQAAGLRCVVSDTVSRESDLLEGNEFLPLSLEERIWAQKILEIDQTYDRAKAVEIVAKKGFCVMDCAKQAERIIEKKMIS